MRFRRRRWPFPAAGRGIELPALLGTGADNGLGSSVLQVQRPHQPRQFWIAALVYAIISIIFAVLGYVTDQSGVVQAVSGIVNLVVFISGLAVGVKRLHDRDKSGWYLLLFYIVPGVLFGRRLRWSRIVMEDSSVIASILGWSPSPSCVWAFVELGCLRGTVGANRVSAPIR